MHSEVRPQREWCSRRRNSRDGHLFDEARDRVRAAISDGFLDEEERADIFHFCERLKSP